MKTKTKGILFLVAIAALVLLFFGGSSLPLLRQTFSEPAEELVDLQIENRNLILEKLGLEIQKNRLQQKNTQMQEDLCLLQKKEAAESKKDKKNEQQEKFLDSFPIFRDLAFDQEEKIFISIDRINQTFMHIFLFLPENEKLKSFKHQQEEVLLAKHKLMEDLEELRKEYSEDALRQRLLLQNQLSDIENQYSELLRELSTLLSTSNGSGESLCRWTILW